jgi:hypothetical protein
MTEDTKLYCANHPTVETTLRCNRCNKPICPKCAVKSPVGYRCRECVRGQQKIFDTAEPIDYVLGFIVAGVLSGVASILAGLISFIGFYGWFILVFVAPFAAGIIAEAVRLTVHKHRSQSLYYAVMTGVVIGAVPVVLLNLLTFNFFGLIPVGIYLVLGVPTVYYRLSGIQLFKS